MLKSASVSLKYADNSVDKPMEHDDSEATAVAVRNCGDVQSTHQTDNDSDVCDDSAEQQPTADTRRRSLMPQLKCIASDVRPITTQPADNSAAQTPVDAVNHAEVDVETPPLLAVRASAGTRSQYHSIQQLSQSGCPALSCRPFSDAAAVLLGPPTWRYEAVDVASGEREDTLQVLRSLLRRYDACCEPPPHVTLLDGRAGNESGYQRGGDSTSADDDQCMVIGHEQQTSSRTSPLTATLQAKRARVEHIVNNIRIPTYNEDAATATGSMSTSLNTTPQSIMTHYYWSYWVNVCQSAGSGESRRTAALEAQADAASTA